MRDWTESNMAALDTAGHIYFPPEPDDEIRASIETSREDGAPTLKVSAPCKEIYIHSKYNPRKDAARWAENRKPGGSGFAFVFGFGLGYHIEALLEKRPDIKKIIAVEAGAEIFRAALSARDMSSLLSNPRLKLLAGSCRELMPLVSRLINEMSGIYGASEMGIFLHQPSVDALPRDAAELRDILEYLRLSGSNKEVMAEERERNIEANKEIFEAARGVAELFGTRAGKPVIVAGAGPSLDISLRVLKSRAEIPEIVAVDSALASFHLTGLRPDFVVSGDPQELASRFFSGLDIEKEKLIFFPSSNPEVAAAFGAERSFAACSSISETEKKIDEIHHKGGLRFSGTVLMAALDFAYKTGGDPILLIGCDFSFAPDRTHASGSRAEGVVSRHGRLRQTPGIDGSPVATSDVLYLFKRVVEDYYKYEMRGNTNLVNCTARGALVEGIQHSTLESALDSATGSRAQEPLSQGT